MQLQALLSTIRILDIVDILVVALILYQLYYLIRDTRAVSLLKGLLLLGAFTILSNLLDLHVVNWLLEKSMTVLIVALPIVFQPELRKALERLGQGRFISRSSIVDDKERLRVIDEVVLACEKMGRERIGALIVFEREVGLNEYSDTGIYVDGVVSEELLGNIFIPNTPLHDGAVLIRDNRVLAAGCLLPLTQDRTLSTELGTRHRAAIGLSEAVDALIVVVSEESGSISYAHGGKIYRHLDGENLRNMLRNYLLKRDESTLRFGEFFKWRKS
ncbi:MAG: diadenylate cyclase CdaA [Veillonellaceae bacterium]|nr:diadenylate cyclase CdaA [Veillonellaceae bacterium]